MGQRFAADTGIMQERWEDSVGWCNSSIHHWTQEIRGRETLYDYGVSWIQGDRVVCNELHTCRYTRVTVFSFPIFFLQLSFPDRTSTLNWMQMEKSYFRGILPFSSIITKAILRNDFRPRDLDIFDGKTNVRFNSYNFLRYALHMCWLNYPNGWIPLPSSLMWMDLTHCASL